MQNRTFVTIATFEHPHQVQLVRSLLESENIPCFVDNEQTVAIYPFISGAIGGIRLRVYAGDEEAARTLLSKLQATQAAELSTRPVTWVPAQIANRFGSRFIDTILVGIMSWGVTLGLLGFLETLSGSRDSADTLFTHIIWVFLLIEGAVYYPVMEANGGTYGKKFLGLRSLEQATRQPISLGKSYVRSFAKSGMLTPGAAGLIYGINQQDGFALLVSLLILLVPFGFANLNQSRQTLYDYLVRVIVIEKEWVGSS